MASRRRKFELIVTVVTSLEHLNKSALVRISTVGCIDDRGNRDGVRWRISFHSSRVAYPPTIAVVLYVVVYDLLVEKCKLFRRYEVVGISRLPGPYPAVTQVPPGRCDHHIGSSLTFPANNGRGSVDWAVRCWNLRVLDIQREVSMFTNEAAHAAILS